MTTETKPKPKGPSIKFYRRHAAFVLLGITPGPETWTELKAKLQPKHADAMRRGVERFKQMASVDVMEYADKAVREGIKDFPKPGVEIRDKAESDAVRMKGGTRRNPNPKGDAKRAAKPKPKRAADKAQGDAADMARRLAAQLAS